MNFSSLPKTISRQWKQISSFEFTRLRLLDADSSVMLLTSLIVGICSGVGAVLFRRLIDWLQNLAYQDISGLMQEYYPLHLILIPAIGGAFVGPLIYYFAREAKGHGVPEVMESLELRGGRIRPRVVVVKSLASSICIASQDQVIPNERSMNIVEHWGGESHFVIINNADHNTISNYPEYWYNIMSFLAEIGERSV